ncbi:MAG: hypothetical protein ACR2FR_05100 [Rubrobacter sp.]|nr:hypothetical protein [Actinomycetota bacterium]
MLRTTGAENFRRTLAGLCLIGAPLVLLVAMIVHGGGGDAGLVKTMAESPGRLQAANLLIMFSSVLFVPALVGLLGLVRGRGVVLAHIGVALAIVGVMGHAVWAGFQIVLLGLVQSGAVNSARMSELISGGPPNAGFVIVMLAFMIGFFLGLLFVAGGLWRSGAVPVWAAVCIFLVPFADFVPGGAIVSILGPILCLIGFGAAGLKLLSMPDAEWSQGQTSSAGEVGVGARPRVQ